MASSTFSIKSSSLLVFKLEGATLERTDLRGIPWLLIMELTQRPDIIWKEVRYDLSSDQGSDTQP